VTVPTSSRYMYTWSVETTPCAVRARLWLSKKDCYISYDSKLTLYCSVAHVLFQHSVQQTGSQGHHLWQHNPDRAW
jgi:hypothetical protein